MSSESCTEGRGEDTGQEKKKQDGVETEEVDRDVCFSPEHRGTQEVTSEGALEQVQRVEMPRRKVSHMRVNQDGRAGGVSICSYPDREGHRDEPRGPGPFYFLGGTNGAEIVSSYFESRGWKRIYNKHREDFKLKWCETKSPANYCNFREGKQLLYQIPNNKVLTTKIGLLSSLREYERVSSKVTHGQGPRRLKMDQFIPTTFRLDVREEREAFFAKQEGERDGESLMWICKPTGLNQGRGIFLLKSQEDVTALRLKLQHMDDSQADKKPHHCQTQARIVQRYIKSPLLLKGKKFDVRSYLLIACTAPYLVFFRHGYVRLTCDLYDPSSNNLSAHLTNQFMQKKNPLYSQLKEDTVWSMESFNTYINDCYGVAKGLPRDWVLGAFTKHMQRIMTQCFFAVKAKLECRLGFFDLIGCDFMVDDDFKVWLLEMNCNPALHTNCEVLREVIPGTVVEMLDLTLEIFNKCRLGQRILPLASQREFVLLYNGVVPADSAATCNKNDTNSESLKKPKTRTQMAKPRRCKSGVEGKNGSAASTDSCMNVTEGGAGRGSSRFRHRLTSTSPSVQRASNLQSVKSKDLRLQLKMKKCTTQATGEEKTRQNTRIIASLTSSELSEGASVSGSWKTAACAPLTGLPEHEDKRREGPGEVELGKETESLVLE